MPVVSVESGPGTTLTVGFPISSILKGSSPLKVAEVIITWVAVQMSALHTGWPRSNKGFKNDPMDHVDCRLATLTKIQITVGPPITTILLDRLLHLPPRREESAVGASSPTRPNRTVIPDSVTGKTFNRKVACGRLRG